MKKIKLFIDPILYYMEDSSMFAGSHYIDLFKGEVISPDVDDISHEDVENEDRYFYIEPITSHEGYEIMQNFVALEESDEIRSRMFDVLEQKKPFLNFKNAIADYPDIQKKFYEYKDNRLKEILKDRLAECGYALEN
ncbi:MAG: UPF0158 family protein [Desulfobacterales bacterium]|nr:UPF0158 family protein [Desulfobacterales bacterium]MCD4787589.1 UPF0158 family protein [Desulfobacterales bacterium]